MPVKLFNANTARSTSKRAPTVVGYYTTSQAAKRLGVDVSTLNYRRDAADAKAFRELIGEDERDETFALLNESRKKIGNFHYYECKTFDAFVKKYMERPNVQFARKTGLTFENGTRLLKTVDLKNKQDIKKLATALERLVAGGEPLSIQIYG